jgi:hypothetical protein
MLSRVDAHRDSGTVSAAPLLSLRQAAGQLGVTRQTVWNWVARGATVRRVLVRLHAEQLGGRWRIEEGDLAGHSVFIPTAKPTGRDAT